MTENKIPVLIKNAPTNNDETVSTETFSTDKNSFYRFLTHLEFIEEPWNDGCCWSCKFHANLIIQKEIRIRVRNHDRPTEETKFTPKELQITMFPYPDLLKACGCKSHNDCPKMIVSGKCVSTFIQDYLGKVLLKDIYTKSER